MPTIDHTKVLRVCMQNTQNSFQLYGDCLDITSTIDQLKNIGASMFSAISPNINWNNQMHWIQTKQLSRPSFNHVHLSASSSNIGLQKEYFTKPLIGGAAILTFGLWSS